ncbi:DeoR/GlpR family DNA-binding transcription regulator [Rhizobium sp. ZPR3]|uniref:DeoR/GlpR family DNA-binding transcription regulator n=2 Tax=unclassified Rhizobium TaxID=2613769 RepID=A0AAU7SR73_9HYPH
MTITGTRKNRSAKQATILGASRRQSILSLIDRGETIVVSDFAKRFDVSLETIRRDIRALEHDGRLRRVHGGATPVRMFDLTARKPIDDRLELDRAKKRQTAKAAMALFADDMNVYLGASSTMLMVAEELAKTGKNLTITTDMIDIAVVAAASGRCIVTLLGGIVSPKYRTVGGYEVLAALEGRLFDLCVLGATGASPVDGILAPTKSHAVLADMLVSRSHQVAIVLDSTKFERRDAHVIMTLDQVDYLSTDQLPPPEMAAALAENGVTVLLPTDHEISPEDERTITEAKNK